MRHHDSHKWCTWAALAGLLLAALSTAAPAEPPVITYVTQPVRHWETFFLFGQGFDAKNVKVLRGTVEDGRSPDDLAEALARGERYQPPQTPPANVGDLYGRQYVISPQVIGGKLQGAVQVFWVRSAEGTSPPFVVNRPEVFFVEFDEVAPGQECRVFGRNMVQAFYPPQPRVYLIDRQQRRVHRCEWGNRHDYQGHLNYQLPYELRFRVPDSVPDGAYELWVHNGTQTGLHGFGGPVPLAVRRSPVETPRRFPVDQFGAKGNGRTDDSPALEKAVAAAAEAGAADVWFPPGDYLLSRPLRVPPGVNLRGMRPGDCRLVVNPELVAFSAAVPREPLPGKPHDWTGTLRAVEGAAMVYLMSQSRVENLGLVAAEPVAWPIAFNAIDSSRFELYQGEPGIVLEPETTGTLLWQLGWPPDGAHLEDRGSGTVKVPY